MRFHSVFFFLFNLMISAPIHGGCHMLSIAEDKMSWNLSKHVLMQVSDSTKSQFKICIVSYRPLVKISFDQHLPSITFSNCCSLRFFCNRMKFHSLWYLPFSSAVQLNFISPLLFLSPNLCCAFFVLTFSFPLKTDAPYIFFFFFSFIYLTP